MAERNRTALVAGVLFMVLGALFLLDRLGIVRLGGAFVLPLLLVGLGAGILLGGGRREGRSTEPETTGPEATEEAPPGASGDEDGAGEPADGPAGPPPDDEGGPTGPP